MHAFTASKMHLTCNFSIRGEPFPNTNGHLGRRIGHFYNGYIEWQLPQTEEREKKCNSFAKPVRNPLLKHSTSDSTHVKLARDVNAGKKVQKLLNCWTDKLTDSLSIVLSLFSSSSQRFPRLKWSLNHLPPPPPPRKLLS